MEDREKRSEPLGAIGGRFWSSSSNASDNGDGEDGSASGMQVPGTAARFEDSRAPTFFYDTPTPDSSRSITKSFRSDKVSKVWRKREAQRNPGANGSSGGGRFNNFEVGGPSGTAGGSGLGSAGHQGFQVSDGAFQGRAYNNGNRNSQGNNFQNGTNGGFNGHNNAVNIQANGGFNRGNAAANNQGNFGGQGMQGYQFNAGSGFNNFGAARNYNSYGRGGFRYFRPSFGRGGGRLNYRRGRGYGGPGNNGGAAVPYVYPPAAVQQHAIVHQQNTQANGQNATNVNVANGQNATTIPVVNPPGNHQPMQDGHQGPVDFIPLEEGEDTGSGVQWKKQKNPDKLKCHRCGLVGHFAIDCITVLCNICELPGHPDEDCPLLHAPKPHMTMYGIGEERLCFF
ncbi:hypothetical protein ACQ4PT_053248 [Festuca glaucescens]